VLPRPFVAIFSLLVVWSEPVAFGREWTLDVPKGATVVAKVPIKCWKDVEGPSFSTGIPIYTVDASAVLTRQDWQTTGLPYFGEFVIAKVVPYYGKPKGTAVELRSNEIWLKLVFQRGADLNDDFKSITFTGTWKEFEGSDYFRNVIFGTLASTIFTGPLSRVSDSAKLVLLRIAGKGLAMLSSESYKDKVYIGLSFPPSGTVYNTIQLNEAARTATVINSRLTLLKSLGVLGADSGFDGIKTMEAVFYRNFASETRANSDSLQVYAPLAAIKRFSSDDITSQQFVDQCVVIVNSNRIQVLLSNAS
jgi:hypothetical protein